MRPRTDTYSLPLLLEAANRMSVLINDLLAYSRVGTRESRSSRWICVPRSSAQSEICKEQSGKAEP